MRSILYSGQVRSMPMKLLIDNKKKVVIRPMVYVQEADIKIFLTNSNLLLFLVICVVPNIIWREYGLSVGFNKWQNKTPKFQVICCMHYKVFSRHSVWIKNYGILSLWVKMPYWIVPHSSVLKFRIQYPGFLKHGVLTIISPPI